VREYYNFIGWGGGNSPRNEKNTLGVADSKVIHTG